MQTVGDNSAVNFVGIENGAGQAWFTAGHIRHRVKQMRSKGNTRAETDARFFRRGVRVTGRNHDTGICQRGNDFRFYHFGCQGDFGDDVGVIAKEFHQLSIRLAHEVRIVGAFFHQVQPRAFKVQAQRLVRVFSEILTHHAHALFHQLVAGGDKRRQEVCAARLFVGFLHNFQRFNGNRLGGIVELYAAAAVKLNVDKARGDNGAINGTLFDVRGYISQWANTFNKAIGDDNRMVIQNFVTGKDPAMG